MLIFAKICNSQGNVFKVEKYELNHLGEDFDYQVTQDNIPNYSDEYKEMDDHNCSSVILPSALSL